MRNKLTRYTKAKFLADVKKEAKRLKETATELELDNLNVAILNPFDHKECVYGQMTGDCFGKRASELIFNCCPKYFVSQKGETKLIDCENSNKIGMKEVKSLVNGSQVPSVGNSTDLKYEREIGVVHYSSIETYIVLKYAKPRNLIAYLKGETKTLKL